MSTELAIRPDQTHFTDQQLAALRALGVQNAPQGDVALLFHHAARTGLDPFARQIYLINRGGKWGIQTAIDGFRVIRERKGTYRGQTEEWCGPDGQWHDVWLDEQPPAAAKVSVFVEGNLVPIVGIARWIEYAQPNSPTWKKMPALMLAKCAEALALRKAFPQDLSGIYTDDEMASQERETVTVQQSPQKASTRPAKDLNAAKRAPVPEPSEEQQAAIVEFADAITETDSVNALRALHHEADQRHLLAYPTREGVRLNDLFHARKAYLSQRDAEDLPPALDGIEDDGGAGLV